MRPFPKKSSDLEGHFQKKSSEKVGKNKSQLFFRTFPELFFSRERVGCKSSFFKKIGQNPIFRSIVIAVFNHDTFQYQDEWIYFSLAGNFGWTGLPFVFEVFTRLFRIVIGFLIFGYFLCIVMICSLHHHVYIGRMFVT